MVPGDFAPPFRAERPQLFWPPYPHRGVAPPEWWLRDPSVGPHGWWAFEDHTYSSESEEVPTEPARPATARAEADAGPTDTGGSADVVVPFHGHTPRRAESLTSDSDEFQERPDFVGNLLR